MNIEKIHKLLIIIGFERIIDKNIHIEYSLDKNKLQYRFHYRFRYNINSNNTGHTKNIHLNVYDENNKLIKTFSWRTLNEHELIIYLNKEFLCELRDYKINKLFNSKTIK